MASAPQSDRESLVAAWQALESPHPLCDELQSLMLIYIRRISCATCVPNINAAISLQDLTDSEKRDDSRPSPPPQRFTRRSRSHHSNAPAGPTQPLEPASLQACWHSAGAACTGRSDGRAAAAMCRRRPSRYLDKNVTAKPRFGRVH